MKKFKRILALLMCVVLALSLTACRIVIDGEENLVKKPTAASGTIGLSVSTLNNPFFVTLAEGAEKAAAKAGVQISVVDAGDDVTKQVSDIEDLVSKGISVLIVNPCDSDAVTGAVEAAKAKGVKVIAVDRAVNGVEIDCQIASDNVLGAELATQYIVDKLGEGVKVAELEGVPGASAAIDRSAGFHNVADEKLDVVAKQTANFDRAEGMSVMENMLQANGDIKAVFAANDEMALGALEAIAGAGKDIMVMGFDATDDAIEAIKAGRMHGTIAQQPALIGSTAVDNAIKLMAGETIAKSIPVEVTLVTAENVDAYAAANTPVEIVGNGSIGLSVSTLNNPFFVTLAEGAEKAAAKAGVAISVVDAGDDVTKQVSDVEDLVAKGISVLIINPCDSDAVTGAVEAAMAKGVHVIAVDRAVNGVTIACQIASDNVLGAELATQYIVDTLGEGVKVAELEGVPGASAAIDRSAGFHNIADAKLDVVAKQTANFDRAEGMSVMENMLQANGDIKAVFAANDEMALGAVEAIAGAGKDIMVMGFDATDDALAAIREGRMAGTIAQQPALIGKTAVENAITLIDGTSIPASIPVAVTLVTAENVDTYADGAEDEVGAPVEIVGNGSIGLSVSTLNNPFFVTLAEGAEAAAAKLGVAISVVDAGDDVTKQVSDVEDLVAKGISVLIINPCDSDAVTGAVESAMAQGVRVIAVDRAVNGVTIDCQIASDNVLGAELATQYIVDTLGNGVKVAELEGVPGASAAIDRSEGFHNVADAKLDVVAKQTANFDRAEGMSVMENMLQANGNIQAVFAANDEMALGAVEAIAGAGKDIMVMGFDATDDALAAIREGRMAGTIAQQPALIGSTAVENAYKLISGEGIPASIPVEVTLVTAKNVDTYADGAGEEVGAPVEIVGNGSIGLSVSTLNNPFFVDLAEGAEAAAAKLGVKISVVDAGDDVTKQVSDVEDLIAKGISVLIINPCDSDAVTGAVEMAMAQGVRVIAVDRAVNGVTIDCQIASDNVLGAELATKYIVEKLGKGVKVAELEGVPGASAAIDRSAGFHNIADKDLDVVAKQTANFDRAEGMSVMENMLQANGNIQAVFAANDEMALGAVEAIAGAGKDIMVMGFDATDDAIAAIKEGRMAGTIAQQPALIGSTAVENAHKLINGKGIPASIPVEVALITIENAK